MTFIPLDDLNKMAEKIESDWHNGECKARKTRQWMKVKDVSEDTKTSISLSYKIIRDLAQELQARGYFTNRGIISRVFFCERYYCEDEPHPFMDVEDVMAILPISRSEGYAVIRELNRAATEEKGCKTIRGRASRKIFREKFYGIEVTNAG